MSQVDAKDSSCGLRQLSLELTTRSATVSDGTGLDQGQVLSRAGFRHLYSSRARVPSNSARQAFENLPMLE